MADVLRPALWDSSPGNQCSVSVDVGLIPPGYPNAGRWIVTIQAHPLPDRKAADVTAQAMAEALNARLGIKLKLQPALDRQ